MSDVTAVPLRPVGKSGIVALWAGIAVLLAGGLAAAYATSDKAVVSAMTPEQFMAANARQAGVVSTADGVEYQVIKAGSGPKPTLNDLATFEYRGTLVNGTQFDASKPGEPVTFPVSRTTQGFAEALTLMPKGATYRVWIPPQLGYGPNPQGPIPGNSVIIFDVTMVDFQEITPEMIQRMQEMQQAQQQPGQ